MSLRIVNVLPIVSARAGGTASFVGPAARELELRGHCVRTIATDLARAPGARPQRTVRRDEIHPAVLVGEHALYPARFPRRLLYSPMLAREVRKVVQGVDLVHIHSLWLHPQYAAARAANAAGVRYVVSPHGSLDPALAYRGRTRKRLTMALWQRQMLERASLIHVTTPVEANLIADVAPLVPRAVVPVGIHWREFQELPDRSAFREQRLDGYDGPLILFLSRLSYKKGIDLLINAFARLRRELSSRLVIAGPDDERLTPSLASLARRTGVESEVMFVGPLFGEERLAALAAADAWVLSSQSENFGVAVIEAMAAGCPVVISPKVNLAPQIRQAGAGLIADLQPDALAEALHSVLTDAELRRKLVRIGSGFASQFDWRKVGDELERVYTQAVE